MGTREDHISIERATIGAFVLQPRRNRLLTLLDIPKRRPDLTRCLDHFRADLAPQFIVEIPSDKQNPADIAKLLGAAGAPDTCHIISANSDIDNTSALIVDTLTRILGKGDGTILCCIAGALAYYEGEGPSERYILRR